ncbi:MAG: helix-turn-helix domain-containing protein [Solirubrobacteraceae bacterium]
MKIVCVEQARVEAELLGGLLACPSCEGTLGPWGHARERVTRRLAGGWRWRPRRARCRGCRGTHVLLADVCLVRRQDEVEVIGAAIEAHIAGEGHRPIAERLGVPAGTVRGWLRRFETNAEVIRVLFTRAAVALDPELGPIVPAGSVVVDAVEAIAVAGRAWVLRFGSWPVWRVVARLSAGGLLCRNTSCLATGAW